MVRLVPEQPAMAWLVTWPLNTELMELKKLDFPAPTGPTSRTRTRDTEASVGLYVLIVSSSSALFLKKEMFMNLPVDLCDLCRWCRSRVAYPVEHVSSCRTASCKAIK